MPTIKTIPPAPKWDLESIFPGGSASPQFEHFRYNAKCSIEDLRTLLKSLPKHLDDRTLNQWYEFIIKLQEASENVEMILSFAHCLISQDVSDTAGHGIEAEGLVYQSEWQKLRTAFEFLAMQQPDDAWRKLLAAKELADVEFPLNEMRRLAKEKMSVELESLALDLGVNGFHAWNRLYDKMAGDLRVEFDQDGRKTTLSLGQLATKMSDADRAVRAQAFAKMTEAWQSRADLAAMALDSLAGYRWTLYDRRGWKSPLHEPLNQARLKQETLDCMWRVIAVETPKLKPYIDAKKKLLGIDKYAWYDQFAPCGKADRLYTFEEAGRFIIDNIRTFSDDMADFVNMALEKRWIEAEDRPGKAGGGYCTRFGPFREGRIFMTYAGTYESLLTLAHELGHLYHGYVLKDHQPFTRHYPMTLAETASVFAELLVTDAALKTVSDPQEKLMLLDQKLQNPYTMFCDIQSRYLFERSFYEERRNGVLGPDRLSQLMLDAQQEAFCDLLDESGYHPLFWASKLHFYITELGFYNFPYTFGFLFAGGVYDRAKKEGRPFAEKYRAMLADSGRMTTEDVAKKHLGVDLTKDRFWIDAVNRSLADVDEFVTLAAQLS